MQPRILAIKSTRGNKTAKPFGIVKEAIKLQGMERAEVADIQANMSPQPHPIEEERKYNQPKRGQTWRFSLEANKEVQEVDRPHDVLVPLDINSDKSDAVDPELRQKKVNTRLEMM